MSAGEKPTLAQQEWVCRARAQIEREDPNGRRADVYEAAADTVSRHAAVLSQLSALSAREKVLREALEAFVTVMDDDEDGGDGLFEERLERILPMARAALSPGEAK